MFDETVSVLENKKINAEYYKLALRSKRVAKGALAGQFLNLQVEDGTDPFLRRPFSYYRVKGNKIEVLYEVFGKGTSCLARKRKGDTLKALGPLGVPFTREIKGKRRVMIAGGVGVPPLVFLAESIGKEFLDPHLLIGCGNKKEVLPQKELSRAKARVLYATDDGSYGAKGFVTVLLHDLLKREDPRTLFIQTCGPAAMMSAVISIAREFGVEGEASVEERMACGVGACLGCVVETKEGFKTSCVEGPVFSFGELIGYGHGRTQTTLNQALQ